jgi:hypothetical protein
MHDWVDRPAVAPPGKWGDFNNDVQDCPSGSYKETFGRAMNPAVGCTPCGTGLWLSEKNFLIYFTDHYGKLNLQQMVRGSSQSCCKRPAAVQSSVIMRLVIDYYCHIATNDIMADIAINGQQQSTFQIILCCQCT